MGRKNNRKKTEYRDRLGFNPRKYISQTTIYPSARSNAVAGGVRFPAGRSLRRGDIWFAELGNHPGTSVQGGCRPVIIVSNDIGNEHAETINVLPMTRHLKRPELPCHTQLLPEGVNDKQQLFDPSMILAEQITTISKVQLRSYVGRVKDPTILERINHSMAVQLELPSELQSAPESTRVESNCADQNNDDHNDED